MFSGWEVAFGLGAFALLLTLAYGVYHTRNVSGPAEQAGEKGAARLYDRPGESDAPPKGGRRHKVPPLIWIMVGLLAAWLVTIFALGDRADADFGRTPPPPPESTPAVPLS